METNTLNYSIDEKTMLVEALEYLLDNMNRQRQFFADSTELLPDIERRKKLKAKLMLDTFPITLREIHPWDGADSTVCGLCDKHFHLNFIFQAEIEYFKIDVCDDCLKKHAPARFDEMKELNKVTVHIPEGTGATDDSLPF